MKMTYEISLNIPVAQRYSILGFPVAKLSIKLIGQRYAPMFAAGAADRHHQLVFAYFNIIWNQKSQQICQLVQKNPRLREAHDIILNAPVVAGQIFQFIYIKRIRQETDIKYQIRIDRYSIFKSK